MHIRSLLLQVIGVFLSLVMLAKAAEDTASHHHGETTKCPECAALPGGRRKYVAPTEIKYELMARPTLDAKLSIVRSLVTVESPQDVFELVVADLRSAPVCVLPARAPPARDIGLSSPPLTRGPNLDSSSPRAPPTA